MGLDPIRRWAAPLVFLVLLTFGCATVRVPASTMDGNVAVGRNGPEPDVELWLESGRQVSEEEKARETAAVKAAVERATAAVVSDDAESLLVVRAQGIARTSSRRTDQVAARVGVAVGVIAAVAIIVVALAASNGKGSAPRVPGVPVVGAPSVRAPSPRPGGVPAPRFRVPATPVASGSRVTVPVFVNGGVVLPGPGPAPAPQVATAYVAYAAPAPEGEEGAARERQEPFAIRLPPPLPLDLSGREFFDVDFTRLELIVVDRASGVPTWTKTVEAKIDPRDAEAVRKLLAAGVEDRGGWARVER